MPGPRSGSETNPEPDPGAVERPTRVRPRPNVASVGMSGFRKRFQTIVYWVLLMVVVGLVAWFLVSSVTGDDSAKDAEATAIATRFAPETATAAAER